jgi:hypothetical protein
MRLTLRTMLACLDAADKLDPADAEELSTKIEQSKYASELAQRIRSVVRHPRIGVPRLDMKGLAFDANAVAEYLDDVLPGDRLGDFERQCLESNVSLAEVAACHQVVVLVLDKPAGVEQPVRERMYRLGAEANRLSAHLQTASAATASPAANEPAKSHTAPSESESATVTPKPKPEVPDYLRAGRGPTLWPFALAAILAFILVAVPEAC